MKQSDIKAFYEKLSLRSPNPTTELNYTSHFELLISVILSAQATDKGVNKATERLFKKANQIDSMLALGEIGLREEIKTIGLYRSKAKNIIAACAKLKFEYGGGIPRTREELESLPGVGRKTANVVLNAAFGEKTIAVDTHVFRVSNRTTLASGKTPLSVEQALMKNTPNEFLQNAHHWLVLHGRYVCIARSPQCHQCVVRKECGYEKKTVVVC